MKMNQIVINQSKGSIFLNKEVYSYEVVKRAVEDFSEVVVCSLRDSRDYFFVLVEDDEIEEVIDEFCNYLGVGEYVRIKNGS